MRGAGGPDITVGGHGEVHAPAGAGGACRLERAQVAVASPLEGQLRAQHPPVVRAGRGPAQRQPVTLGAPGALSFLPALSTENGLAVSLKEDFRLLSISFIFVITTL